jgi:hypothetical protein
MRKKIGNQRPGHEKEGDGDKDDGQFFVGHGFLSCCYTDVTSIERRISKGGI